MPRRTLAAILALTLAAAACGGTDTATEPALTSVEAGRFAALLDDPPPGLVVLDVRTPDEFAAGHIGDAVNIDYYEASFRDRLDALDKTVPYALYCRSGNRSGETLEIMRGLGFTDVTELSGGVIAWYEAGYPLEG